MNNKVMILSVFEGVSKKNGKQYYAVRLLICNFVKTVFLYENEYKELVKALDTLKENQGGE